MFIDALFSNAKKIKAQNYKFVPLRSKWFMLKEYSSTLESQMRTFYESLPERERWRYAAIEAQKLGWGGKTYIAKVLGLHSKTLLRAIKELTNPDSVAPLPTEKQRRSGGGRKKKV